MSKEYRKYFGKKFYKQQNGYWANMMPIHAHRWVWINHNGAIPKGMDIHHIDGDKSNNEIENLKMLSRAEHIKEHWKNEKEIDKRLAQLDGVRPSEWLKSDEGRKFISDQGKEIWKKREPHIIICQGCGIKKEFIRWAKFCSKNCYMKWCWRNKFNFIESKCPVCDKYFKCPKSKSNQCCSHECGMINKKNKRL